MQIALGDHSGKRVFPSYLYSASEFIDQAADVADSLVTAVHDNERRWKVFEEGSTAITLDTHSHVLPNMQSEATKAMEEALS